MILRFRDISLFWRIITVFILPKHKVDIYNATTDEVKELKEWLNFQGIKYATDTTSYYSAKNIKQAEKSKAKITIHVRNEEHLMALKLQWC